MKHWLIGTLLMLCVGCVELNQAEIQLRADMHAAVTTFGTAAAAYDNGANLVATKALTEIAGNAEEDWQAWLAGHTSADGRLVSLAPDGSQVPMLRADMEQAVAMYHAQIAAVQDQRERWFTFRQTFNGAVDALLDANDKVAAEELNLIEAKQSVQNLINRTIQVVGPLIGAGVGLVAG